MKKQILPIIIKKIKAINDVRPLGLTISTDRSNEEIQKILSGFLLDDDEDLLEKTFGLGGLHAIRDAETGIY